MKQINKGVFMKPQEQQPKTSQPESKSWPKKNKSTSSLI
jgi:hypothetical protein